GWGGEGDGGERRRGDATFPSAPALQRPGGGGGTADLDTSNPQAARRVSCARLTVEELSMKKRIDVATLAAVVGTLYPEPFDRPCRARERTKLGEPAGLTQFGVNLCRLPPGRGRASVIGTPAATSLSTSSQAKSCW